MDENNRKAMTSSHMVRKLRVACMFQHTSFYLWMILYFKSSLFSVGEDSIADVPRSGLSGAADEGGGWGRGRGLKIQFIPETKGVKKERWRQYVNMGLIPCSNSQWHKQESI